jgi:hypothetical protein
MVKKVRPLRGHLRDRDPLAEQAILPPCRVCNKRAICRLVAQSALEGADGPR